MKRYRVDYVWAIGDDPGDAVSISVRVDAKNEDDAIKTAQGILGGVIKDADNFVAHEPTRCPRCGMTLTEVEIEDSECYACGSHVAQETDNDE